MLKENTVFWSRARACSNAALSPRCRSCTACSISERIAVNVARQTSDSLAATLRGNGGAGKINSRAKTVRGTCAQKVYPTDQHIREFLGQWIHSLATPAEEPFWTTRVKSLFPPGFASFRWTI